MTARESNNRDGTLSSTPHFNSPPPEPRRDGQRSSSRRRLTTSLGNLLGKRTDSSTGSVNGSSTPSSTTASTPRRMSFTSRRSSSDGPGILSTSTSTEPSSTRSKPPVSLPSFFRRRGSSAGSATGRAEQPQMPPTALRGSFDEGPRRPPLGIEHGLARTTSEGSTDYSRIALCHNARGERTDSGGTTSSRDAPASSRGWRSPASALTSQSSCSRRNSASSAVLSDDGSARSPDAEEQEESMSSGSDDGDEEDIRDFVAASGSSTAPPHATPASPFSTHSRFSAMSDEVVPPLDSPSSDEASPPRPISPPPIQARRLTANNLTLPSFSGVDTSSSIPVIAAAPNGSSATASTSRTPSGSLTERRMRTLPRLLSNDAYSFEALRQPVSAAEAPVAEGDELETGESETDTETEEEGDEAASPAPHTASTSTSTPATTPAPTRSTPSSTPRPLGLTMSSVDASAAPPTWVTFDAATPTPGHPRTARVVEGGAPSDSYFDIPRSVATTSARTPGAPLMTPLIAQSISSVARGQRPTRQDEAGPTMSPATTPGRVTLGVPRAEGAALLSPSADTAELGGASYRRRANSAVAMLSPSLLDSDEEPVGTAAVQGLDPVWQTGGLPTPGPSFLSPAVKPASPEASKQPQPQPASPTHSRPSVGNRLHRPRSMYELHTAPPAYHSVYTRAGLGPAQIVFPREEEGKEGLPDYTCAIHIEGYMPRKMEFTAPSVQAKDRAWKRQYVVLHGTSIKFYKYDLKTHPIAGEEDWAGASAAMAGREGPPPLHFHAGEYGVEVAPPTSKFPTSMQDVRAKAKSRIVQATTASDTNVLLRHYSLQNAESGLAADYIKRKHVVRVRAEGEQFLLQTMGDRGTIDLIEVLQAATNVALDLDARPLPKFITLPRRRRRRRRPDAAAGASGATGAAAGTAANANAEPASGAAAAVEEPDRMGDMLAEEQREYSTATSASAV